MKASTHHPFGSCVVDRTASPWLRDALWVVVLMGTVGCVGGPTSLTDEQTVTIEKVSSQAARVWWADVRANTRETWATGEVIRHKEWPANQPGHVDIEVISRDGQRIAVANGALQPVQTAAGGSRRLTFRMSLPERPFPGSTVRVIHHTADDAR